MMHWDDFKTQRLVVYSAQVSVTSITLSLPEIWPKFGLGMHGMETSENKHWHNFLMAWQIRWYPENGHSSWVETKECRRRCCQETDVYRNKSYRMQQLWCPLSSCVMAKRNHTSYETKAVLVKAINVIYKLGMFVCDLLFGIPVQ